MRTLKKFTVIAIGSTIFAMGLIAIDFESFKTSAIVVTFIAAMFGGFYSLNRFMCQMSRQMDNKTETRQDGTPTHSLYPMWKLLGFCTLAILLTSICTYLATHIWCLRDLMNFEMAVALSGGIVYLITHPRKK